MKRFDYYKAAVCTPPVSIGNPKANVDDMLRILQSLDPDTQLAVFPELAVTGYTCADLFYEDILLKEAMTQLVRLAKQAPANMAVITGIPLKAGTRLFNAAAFLFDGKVLGFYVKRHLPGYNEYYEPRWFSPARDLDVSGVKVNGVDVPVSGKILFADETTDAVIGIEICEDLWVAVPPSSDHAQAGANILVNCSASNEVIAKNRYRRDLVSSQSAKTYSGYLYCSAGPDESSTDLVFSGADLMAENGKILAETASEESISCEIDLQHLKNDRLKFKTSLQENREGYTVVTYASANLETIELTRAVEAYPFVPGDLNRRLERCETILGIQAQGLATRLKKIGCRQAVIGISGGLDSTLALLVTVRAFRLLRLPVSGITAVTMPGFGTTKRTKSNADELMELLGVTRMEVPIAASVRQHFADIGQDESVHDITYENGQARERTQILMDLANKVNGIVVGTGDLSELALGWCTYNGDHMSMYAVNASVPKTLVRYLVESEALSARKAGNEKLERVLLDICDTPVSPELLPPDKDGNIAQKTEEVLGSYDLHDFFLYHMLRYHESPEKIFELARLAFPQVDAGKIKESLRTFYRRFFAQQFKRSCLPDGPKVGSICLSPRGDWRMPSDASAALWLKQAEELDV
ncbi:NAD(+) synthase [Faecalibaculum rodentium]|uniref:Glutamine-dependent NAD(+) synthetase n=1 Tax=Faecalibaculum rodentium TaxID=1702221 RepID=A0A1Q9YNI4_9FIRM|nr:NAD(+) synthase [Faecalibaculum rodentium]OLU47367.1 NAD(+) synthase [Faecalibaculum rodentium]